MIVDDLQRSTSGGRCEISARVRRGAGEELRLWWRFPAEFAPQHVDGSPFLAGVLSWCMRHEEDLVVDAPVSPRLAASVRAIVAVFRSLFPATMRPIEVNAEAGPPPPSKDITGSYFSRGVDSWFTTLTALEDDPQTPPLTHLVFSPGFLSRWDSEDSVRATTASTRSAAARTGLQFVEVDTNLKWDFGGAQIASTALALGFRRMLLPSGAMHGEIVPAVTHPVLDHRFSTERTEVVHYGDASRLDKVARVAQSQDALDTLYVCQVDDPRSADNCGRCEKCGRTMLALYLAGALDRTPTMPATLDHARIEQVQRRLGRRQQWVDALHALGESAPDRQLAAAARLVIAQSDLKRAVDAIDDLAADPALSEINPRLPTAVARARRLTESGGLFLHPRAPTRLQALPARLGRRLRTGILAKRSRQVITRLGAAAAARRGRHLRGSAPRRPRRPSARSRHPD